MIALDLTATSRQETGTTVYASELARCLCTLAPDRIRVVLPPGSVQARLLPSALQVHCPVSNELIAKQMWFPIATRCRSWTAVHYPVFPPPVTWRGRALMTVHDLTPWRFPETMTMHGRSYFRLGYRFGAMAAERVFTYTAAMRDEVVDTLKVDAARIVTTPLAPRALGSPHRPAWAHVLPEQYLLTVATLEPRKNLKGLLAAMPSIWDAVKAPITLVAVGRPGWGRDAIATQTHPWGRVIVPGHVTPNELAWLFSKARMFVSPSLYEGFGLPPVEALSLSCPVAVSRIAAHSEVLGQGVRMFDPTDVTAIAEAVADVWSDPERWPTQSVVAHLTWENTAKRTLAVYADLARN